MVEIALELAGQPPLVPAKAPGLWPDPKRTSSPVFRLPALAGSWAQCAEGLAHPFTGQARPFVFDHALAKGREDVVLVHLNHRLVQMSLRLLRAEVWSQQGRQRLFRATARVVPGLALRHPALIAHARLVVVGGDGHRLHEEIIFAGGEIREGKFVRYGALRDIQNALDAATDEEPSEEVKQRLMGLWRRNAEPLRQTLEARSRDRTDSLKEMLAKRGEGSGRHHGDSDRTSAGHSEPTERPRISAGVPAGIGSAGARAIRAEC